MKDHANTFVAFAIALSFSIACIVLFRACGTCQDYSYKLSRLPFNRKVASCGPGMETEIEHIGLLGGQIVHCRCPATR